MSYKIYLFSALNPIEWSQAGWKVEGRKVELEDCKGELIHDVFFKYLPRDGLILDAGCGVARWPIYLRQFGYKVFGVEFSHDACQIAHENDATLNVLRGDIRHMPLPANSIDAVLSLGVVEHDESGPMVALHETRRIMKQGGILVLAVPYNNPFRRAVFNPLMSYMTRKRRRAQWKLGFAEYRFTGPEVRDFLERSGFEVIASYPNELKPPKNMGLWVDYNNLTINPFRPLKKEELFVFPGLAGRVAGWLTQRLPWLVCGEIICVARAR